jgi:hypothetical protein
MCADSGALALVADHAGGHDDAAVAAEQAAAAEAVAPAAEGRAALAARPPMAGEPTPSVSCPLRGDED